MFPGLVLINNFDDFPPVTSSAQMDGSIFHFSTLEDGSSFCFEIKQANLPKDDPESNMSEFIKEATPSSRLLRGLDDSVNLERDLQTTVPTIDIMVLYTRRTLCGIVQAGSLTNCEATATRQSIVKTRIELAIQEANVAFANSGIHGRLRLVHSYLADNYDENTQTYSNILLQMGYATDGILDDMHTLRSKYGADVVTMLVDNPASCGLAFQGSPVAKTWAFSVVNWVCATGYYSFVHEVAHHLGAMHDRMAQTCPDPQCCTSGGCYKYGYIDPLNRFRSIMSYDCPIDGGCPRVQMFSQPELKYTFPGSTSTIKIGTTSINNAKTIRDTFATVAAYNSAVVNPTKSPTKVPVKSPTRKPTKSPTKAPVAPIRCGNGICEPQFLENCKTCPKDCIGGTYKNAQCGNNICENGENCKTCPQDCPLRLDVLREDLRYCCQGGPVALSGTIQYGVSCSTFSYCQFNNFCDIQPAVSSTYCCGNGTCELGETVSICSADCKCKTDGICDVFEDGTCPDCAISGTLSIVIAKCMATGRVCASIYDDPCCGSCDPVSKLCV